MKLKATEVSLSGTATITHEGTVSFHQLDDTENQAQVLAKPMSRNGRMHYHVNGDLQFTPYLSLSRTPAAPQVETIHQDGPLRIEQTSRHFIVHVKVPITHDFLNAELLLDEEITHALEVIMKKKNELTCGIL